ncbi:MAG: hypothetical protein IKU82_06015 [Clostridia bacterium]|nr:hypothetical protein [Clostridia bacterium]
MLKKIMCAVLALAMLLSLSACDKNYNESDLPEYSQQEFEICGLWAPHEITESAFQQYKDAGFNVMSFTNHDEVPRSTENQYFIGSKRTDEALKICKKIGIDVYLAYGASWFNRHNEGDEYFDNKPFSTYNYYGEYMDIIKGIHINDEPNKETMAKLAKDDLIEDYIKVYGDRKYMINLIPATAVTSRDFVDYDEMLQIYGETIMSKFNNPYICVDVYPYSKSKSPEQMIIYNYNEIAKCAKKYNAETSFILQSSTGTEFLETLSEADMRQQAYLAIAFGADNLQYYCYSVPRTTLDDGSVKYLYNHCMLNHDGTPNQLYYDVKTVNNEIQKFASAVLAYNWQQTIGVSGTVDQTFRVASVEYDKDFNPITKFDSDNNYVSSTSSYDMIVSHFASEEFGDAYMFVNFSRDDGENNKISATFKDCGAVAIYGGAGYSGTPEIVTLNENGEFSLELVYGEGVFVVPLV